jgi:predicted Zn-dependent peptidase
MTKLKNGLKVAYKKTREKAVYLELLVKAGSGHEEPTAKGVAHYLEHVKFNTEKYGEAEAIFRVAKENSMQLNAYTWKRETVYTIKTLPESLEFGLGLLNQIVFNSKLTEACIEKERGIIQNEIIRRPEFLKEHALNSKVFEGINADNVIGLTEQVAALTLEDIKTFQEKHYVPNNMCLIIAGPCGKQKEVLEKVVPIFGDYEKKNIKKTTKNKLQKKDSIIFNEKEDQTYKINIASVIPEAKETLAERILQNAAIRCINEKLTDYFREELSMVYNVFSWREKLEKETTFSTRTDLRGKTEVLDFLNKYKTFRPLIAEKMNETDVNRNIKGMVTKKRFQEDDSNNFIDEILNFELHGQKRTSEKEVLETLNALTFEQVKAEIEKILKEEFYTVVSN